MFLCRWPSRSLKDHPTTNSPEMPWLWQTLCLLGRCGGRNGPSTTPLGACPHCAGLSTVGVGSAWQGCCPSVGCAHRPGADAVCMLAAVPIPAICAAVNGLADVAVTPVPRSTGAGDIDTKLRAGSMRGTATVVLATHVNGCMENSVTITGAPFSCPVHRPRHGLPPRSCPDPTAPTCAGSAIPFIVHVTFTEVASAAGGLGVARR